MAAIRFRSKVPSLFLALACNPSSWGSAFTSPSSSSSSASILKNTIHSTSYNSAVGIRGGSLYAENEDNNDIKPKTSTGWIHSQPDSNSKFWTGAKELPKGVQIPSPDTIASVQTASSKDEEKPRTGWLHSSPTTSDANKKIDAKAAALSSNKARQTLERAMKDQKVNHRIITPPTFHPVGEGRRAVITEHKISVPLNRYNPPPRDLDPEPMVDVYFSIVELVTNVEEEAFFQSLQGTSTSGVTKAVIQREQKKRASDYKAFAKLDNANQCCLYLQGGPGFGAPVPIDGIGLSDKSSWVGSALSKGFKRIVLMDQRGTGRSTPITKQTLETRFPGLFELDNDSPSHITDTVSSMQTVEEELIAFDKSHPEAAVAVRKSLSEATDYMTHFRADNIVKDAEAIKDTLLLPCEDDEEKKDPQPRPWGAALGQSFGGFCMMSYLSLIPHPPMICLFTGGIAPMCTHVDDVYSRLRERVKDRNLLYFNTYPGDVDIIKNIVRKLEKERVKLPSGGILTARRFLQVGIGLGGSPSAFASIHSLCSSAFVSDDDDDLSRAFLKAMDSTQPFDDHPIYYLMHESIYADGTTECKKTEWSAFKAYQGDSEFDYKPSIEANVSDPTLLTGEVVFPWMSDGDYAELSGMGMRALAQSLAYKNDWRDLYNVENMKKALAVDGTGVSKAAAAVYYDDMYVDFNACMTVTKRGGPLENCKVWISNEYQHSGLRDDGSMIFNKLLGMAKGQIGTLS